MQLYLIDIQDFRRLTPVSFNLDEQWLNGIWDYCQNEIIQCLGASLVTEILDQINANTLTPANVELLNLIKPVFCWSMYSNSVMYVSYRMENKGMTHNLDNSAVQISSSSISKMQLDAKQKSDYYFKILIKFLNTNHLAYPLYPYQSDCDDKNCKRSFPLFV